MKKLQLLLLVLSILTIQIACKPAYYINDGLNYFPLSYDTGFYQIDVSDGHNLFNMILSLNPFEPILNYNCSGFQTYKCSSLQGCSQYNNSYIHNIDMAFHSFNWDYSLKNVSLRIPGLWNSSEGIPYQNNCSVVNNYPFSIDGQSSYGIVSLNNQGPYFSSDIFTIWLGSADINKDGFLINGWDSGFKDSSASTFEYVNAYGDWSFYCQQIQVASSLLIPGEWMVYFDVVTPYIWLPVSLAKNITSYISEQSGYPIFEDGVSYYINTSSISKIPNITFGNLTLKPESFMRKNNSQTYELMIGRTKYKPAPSNQNVSGINSGFEDSIIIGTYIYKYYTAKFDTRYSSIVLYKADFSYSPALKPAPKPSPIPVPIPTPSPGHDSLKWYYYVSGAIGLVLFIAIVGYCCDKGKKKKQKVKIGDQTSYYVNADKETPFRLSDEEKAQTDLFSVSQDKKMMAKNTEKEEKQNKNLS